MLAFSSFQPLVSSIWPGGIAQLGEHLPCKQGVKGSIPFVSILEAGNWGLGTGKGKISLLGPVESIW